MKNDIGNQVDEDTKENLVNKYSSTSHLINLWKNNHESIIKAAQNKKLLKGGARKKATKTTRKPGAAKKKSSSKPAAATGKVHTGPRGGKFVLRNGHKVYV
jgi:hypothetical protein